MTRTEQLIARHEGFRNTLYTCPAGKKTIGYGFNLDAGMTEEEAMVLLRLKINHIRERLSYAIISFNSLSARRQDVLVSMAYNLGMKGLLAFRKMLAAINEGNFSRAKMELLDSNAARELHNRYAELAEMMENG